MLKISLIDLPLKVYFTRKLKKEKNSKLWDIVKLNSLIHILKTILKSIRKDEPENWDDYFLKPSLPYSKKEIIINRNDIEFIFSESLHLLILP